MNKKNHEGTFIPCGDSMERMEEIREEELENVSGGYDFFDVPVPGWEEGVTPAGAIEVD